MPELETGIRPADDSLDKIAKDNLPLEALLDLAKAKSVKKDIRLKFPHKLLHDYEAFLIPAIVLFLTGCALAAGFPDFLPTRLAITGPMILILLGICIASLSQGSKRWVVRSSLWMVALLSGCLFYPLALPQPPAHDVSRFIQGMQQSPASISAILVEKRDSRRVVLAVTKVNGTVATGKVLADLPFARPASLERQLDVGRKIQVIGFLSRPYHSPVPGTFNQEGYLAGQGITAMFKKTGHWLTGSLSDAWPFPLQRAAEGLKDKVLATLRHSLPSPQAEIFGGLILGDKAIPVDRDTKQAFIDTGLIHLLAASGMNVGIIAAAVYFLLGKLKMPNRFQVPAAMAAVAFYSLLTGLPPSIQRASAMLEIALFLKMLNRELSGTFLLCVVTVILVILNPTNITNVGFQFSVLTTFGLLTMLPPLQSWLGYYITRWLAGLVLIPAVAQLWVWPLSVVYFNRFPLHTVPFNILALCLITPLTLLGFASAVLSLFIPNAASAMAGLAKPLINALLWLVQWGDGMCWAQWSLPSPSPWQLLALYGLLFLSLAGLTYIRKGLLPAWPTKRALIFVLVPPLLFVSALAIERLVTFSKQEIIIVPLTSPSHNDDSGDRLPAILFRPAATEDWNLSLPERISFWESRTLSDYLRHRQIRRLRSVLLLPDNSKQSISTMHFHKKRNYIAKAFSETDIQHLILPRGVDAPSSLMVANVPEGQSSNDAKRAIHRLNSPAELRFQVANQKTSQSLLLLPDRQLLLSGKTCLLSIPAQRNHRVVKTPCAYEVKPEAVPAFIRLIGNHSALDVYSLKITNERRIEL